MARPFNKLKGISKRTDDFALKHNRRTLMFSFTSEEGSSIALEGSVLIEDISELVEVFKTISKLTCKKS